MFRRNKVVEMKLVAIISLVLLLLYIMPIPVGAHMPRAEPPPEFEMESIIIDDGGTEIEITIDDVGNYFNEMAKSMEKQVLQKEHQNWSEEEINNKVEEEFAGADGKCPCVSCAFRAALLGISKVWNDETPERDDIKIISNLSTPGSCQCFQYITGTCQQIEPEPKTKGEFHIILPNGTDIKNKSMENVRMVSGGTKVDNWKFNITRKSTGEYFVVDVKDDVFPEGFFELCKKVKFGKPENATAEETNTFRSEWEELRNAFLTKPDWELFEGIEEPVSGIMFLVILGVCGVIGAIEYMIGKRLCEEGKW
jgi:hypothetical protein